MDIDTILLRFNEIALAEATKKRDTVIRENQATSNKILKEFKREITEETEHLLENELMALRNRNGREFSDMNLKLKREIIARESELTDEIFAEATAQILSFKRKPQYKTWLAAKIEEARRLFADAAIKIFVSDEDRPLIDEAIGEIEPLEKGELGGIRILCESRRIMLDFSFGQLINKQREQFGEVVHGE